MNDLIERQAAIDALDFEIVHMTAYCDGKNEGNPLAQYNKGLEDGKKAIEALPTIQPERADGYWIRRDCGLDVECKCSACGYKDFVSPHDTYWFKRNYCPNCGAKMKGERQK